MGQPRYCNPATSQVVRSQIHTFTVMLRTTSCYWRCPAHRLRTLTWPSCWGFQPSIKRPSTWAWSVSATGRADTCNNRKVVRSITAEGV